MSCAPAPTLPCIKSTAFTIELPLLCFQHIWSGSLYEFLLNLAQTASTFLFYIPYWITIKFYQWSYFDHPLIFLSILFIFLYYIGHWTGWGRFLKYGIFMPILRIDRTIIWILIFTKNFLCALITCRKNYP